MEQSNQTIKNDLLISAKSFDRKRLAKHLLPKKSEKVKSLSSSDSEEVIEERQKEVFVPV